MNRLIFMFFILLMASCQPSYSPIPADLEGFEIVDIPTVKDARMATAISGKYTSETGTIVGGVKQGTWITYHPNTFYPSIIANYLDGKLNGPYISYTKNGQLSIIASCIDGEFDGYYTEYESNKIRKEQYFIRGVLDGETVDYFPRTDQKRSVLTYKNGVLDGKSSYYNEAGELTQEYEYKNGEQIDVVIK